MHLNFVHAALLALLALSAPSDGAKLKQSKDAILLSNVKSLTLRANQKTSHRRVSAIPQLKCSGTACKHYTVDVMRCTNQGADYNAEDVQWSCTANLPAEFKLGSTEVICEGYSSPDDDFVLKGSCGVEYRLVLTDKGEEKYGGSFWSSGKSKARNEDEWEMGSILFMLAFLGILGWILYSAFLAWRSAPNARRLPREPGGGWGGGWGGGGGGGGGPGGYPRDPPPPYPGKPYSTRQQGFQPGFWSGVLGGAAAGYMAGNRGQRQQEPVIQRGGSWFGGNSMGGPSRQSTSSSSSSSARHDSTGFGSTSRR